MELPNSHFQDFPIEFKEINPSDFPNFEVGEKIIIEPNENGYIFNSLTPHLELGTKNTIVINSPVGYGKSYAIIMTIKDILQKYPNSLIIVASPFVSLVEQYKEDINKIAQIPVSDIYDYSNIGRNFNISYIDKRVQVVTVNTLLGNPGEDSFKNSDAKRKYINSLINKCNKNNTKVFFIYDEIHDAIQNFKEEYVFNLWKWKDVIFKNFIISATYSEASKVVIEYLAELTEKKISIIEAKRIRFPEKQSKLYLHYSSSYNFSSDTDELVNVIDDLLNRNKGIDILCYSKTLSKSIISDDIGKKLKKRFGTINDCTSELVSNQRPENEPPQNRYNETMCNVGTNFKSGVSITKKNHALVIIMPPRITRLWFKNKYGIFSGGNNSIIQAIARQRNKGEIHIILPRPDKFDFDSLKYAEISDKQIDVFKNWYTNIEYFDDTLKPVFYSPLIIQNALLQYFYLLKLKANVDKEIEHIQHLERDNLPRLEYPTYEIFKLESGEEYLANSNKFFGEDISAYLTYCAFTNQFINCNLSGITYKTALFFEEGKLQENLNHYFNKYFGEDYYNSVTTVCNFKMFYTDFRKSLFNTFDVKYHKIPISEKQKEKPQWTKITPYKNKDFENQLLRFCAILYYQKNYYYKEDFENKKIDIDYTRSNYFLDSIVSSRNINIDEINCSIGNKNKIKAYQSLDYFRTKLIDYIGTTTRGEIFNYLPLKPLSGFIDGTKTTKALETIDLLIENDELIKNDIFNFRRNFEGKTRQQKIESFYTILVEDFVEIKLGRISQVKINNLKTRVKLITSIKLLPFISNGVIDLINPAGFDENYLQAIKEFDFENFASEIAKFNSYEEFKNHQNDEINQLFSNQKD